MESNPGQHRSASAIFRCALALALVAAAGYLFCYIAVIASAWFGGKLPGFIAVVLSVMAVAYFFTPGIYSFQVNRDSLPLFIDVSVSALVVGWFSSWRRQAVCELQYARDELQLTVFTLPANHKTTS
jgi:K+-sensing histidine kinase KdpD